ncbi:MAG: relaxase domain-containing protein [Actinomycetota bacterium]|nr:relaxase domain-containing protein [Actinomycetota bacterium]
MAAHKTVAVLGLIGRADDMHAILDAETDAILAFLDEWFSRQGGRRGKDQRRTATSRLLYAHTRDATTRAGDPGPPTGFTSSRWGEGGNSPMWP